MSRRFKPNNIDDYCNDICDEKDTNNNNSTLQNTGFNNRQTTRSSSFHNM